MFKIFGNNCTNDATLRLARTISIGARLKTRCRTALRHVRWLPVHYDLKTQTAAVEATQYNQPLLNSRTTYRLQYKAKHSQREDPTMKDEPFGNYAMDLSDWTHPRARYSTVSPTDAPSIVTFDTNTERGL